MRNIFGWRIEDYKLFKKQFTELFRNLLLCVSFVFFHNLYSLRFNMFDVLEFLFFVSKCLIFFYFQCGFYELIMMNCKFQDTLIDFIELSLV